ncbi:glycosyltransferase family 2 protein [Ruegeria arenilitoris]|uniref:glycosyltransferase family 2 protein n=1 Tax=Ruegeria arenilitoris TaxID=1173585 RepID=UPI00147AABCA|nr:glycosyltransferase family 2 protein [Ruegeria arenilitoris]
MTRLLITAMKNEAPYILEWVAYHKLIGFDNILVYSNDCSDGTDILLDALAARGWLTHERNQNYVKKGVQWTALNLAGKHELTKAAEWILFSDIDEFVNIKTGAGKLDDLFTAVPDADAFALTWRLFGNSGKVDFAALPILEEFTRAAPLPCFSPWEASHFKTLFRNNGAYQKLGVHRPKKPKPSQKHKVRWVNGSGQLLPALFQERGLVTFGQYTGMDLVCLNHYSVKSALAYLVKSTRGLPNRSHQEIGLRYWVDRNFNTVEETSIQRNLPALKEALNELHADDELRRLSQEGLNWHRQRADQVMNTWDGLQLLIRIVGIERSDIDPHLARKFQAKRTEIRGRLAVEKNDNTG